MIFEAKLQIIINNFILKEDGKMKRRKAMFVCAMVGSAILCSCAMGANADETYEIAYIAKNATSNWGQRLGKGITKFNEEHENVNVIYDGPQAQDSASQTALVESYIAQQVDALIVNPLDIQALEPTLKSARDSGIVVITNEASTGENIDYDVESVINTEFGEMGLEQIIDQLEDRSGTYVYMVGLFTNISHNQWGDAAEAHLANYPDLTLGERVESGESADGAYNKTIELIKTYPDFVAIQASSAAELPGICNAVEQAGLSGKIVIGGLGIPSQVSQYLESGVLKSCITWDPMNASYACCSAALKVLEGEKIEEGSNLGLGFETVDIEGKVVVGSDINIITKDNWETFGF